MKKLFIGFVALALFLMGAMPLLADTVDLSGDQWCITNDTGDKLVTTIPITILVPGEDKIIKITVAPTATAVLSEAYVAIYDASSETAMQTNGAKVCEGEIEADGSSFLTATKDYPRGLHLSNGATFIQGAYSAVTVEWEYSR